MEASKHMSDSGRISRGHLKKHNAALAEYDR